MQSQQGQISATGNGFKVKYEQRMGKFGISVGYTRYYYVKYGLNQSEQESVALGIFKEVSEGFEGMQAGPPFGWFISSGFSEEDLFSDLIGFYRGVKGFTREEIETWCMILSKKDSEKVWDATDGLKKNKSWKPIDHNDSAACCDDPMRIPGQLNTITSTPKGDLWRNWYEKDIDVF